MKALVFRYSLPRLAFARVFGLVTPRAYLSRGSPLSFKDGTQLAIRLCRSQL